MASQLLHTKFYAPKPRGGRVARPGLIERLRRGDRARLTLVSAPAGFGKSTLLAEWLAAEADGSAAAWLSLDPSDDHPGSFWTHVVAALQTAIPEVGASSLALLASPDQAIEVVLAPLINELDARSDAVVLVLDDYHSIGSTEIHDGMTFLLDHLPPHVRLVLVSRSDPPLPLARLRARGELTEIRASDLRFTADEAEAYFNDVLGLGLSAGDVATLEDRTEGWVAALQLAALSMQGRDDLDGFIRGFAGDDRYIVDYLVEEVLRRQSPEVRAFLLQTSVLDRLTGPLCDTVTGQPGSKATLEALDRANLFLVPLDDRRQWYRYHHLFADVLEAHLLDEAPDRVPDLHRRASAWYEAHGERSEAIRHAIAGGDVDHAADLIELALPTARRLRQDATIRRWLEALPDEVVRVRPVLSNGYAGALLVRGAVDGVEARLRDAERWLVPLDEASTRAVAPSSRMVVADEAAFATLPGWIAIHRAGLARLRGDAAETIAQATRALELVSADDPLGRGAAAALLGLAIWAEGDVRGATQRYAEAMADLERAGHLSDVMGCAIALSDLQRVQGRLTDALRTLERGRALADGPGGAVLRGAADMHVGISEILLERGDLAGATWHLHAAEDLGEDHGLPQNPYRSRVAMAGIRAVEGDTVGALALLDEAERRYFGDFSPDVRPIAALRARMWIVAGQLPEAAGWARERGLRPSDDLTYLHEFEHITLARTLVARGPRARAEDDLGSAIDLLGRLLAAAEAGGRTGSVIDILVAAALAHHARGDATAARAALVRALDLAEPEGYVRIFVDEGRPMTALLRLAASGADASPYARRLLAATASTGAAPVRQPLIEPLSERELEVLRLLESDLDGPDIARELSVSLPTVRTHTRNVYAKLGVNNRRAAVRRAAELGLLTRGEGRRPTA